MSADPARLISVKYSSRAALRSSLMPFVERGGIYIPADLAVSLGTEVFCLLELPGLTDPCPVTGKVVWISARQMGSRCAGFGFQLDEPLPALDACLKSSEAEQRTADSGIKPLY